MPETAAHHLRSRQACNTVQLERPKETGDAWWADWIGDDRIVMRVSADH